MNPYGPETMGWYRDFRYVIFGQAEATTLKSRYTGNDTVGEELRLLPPADRDPAAGEGPREQAELLPYDILFMGLANSISK